MSLRRRAVAIAGALVMGGALTAVQAPAASALATPTINVFDTFVIEETGEAILTLRLTEEPTATVRVTVSTSDGTATAGGDYVTSSRVIEFVAGNARKNFVTTIIDDAVSEPQESFTVTLSAPEGLIIGDGSAVVAIVDDELAPAERNCTDDNPYTTDTFDATAGYCTHTFAADKDLDDDLVAASETGGPDCDDTNAAVKPGAVDVVGNGIDDNCDGRVDGAGPRNCDDANAYTADKYASRQGYCRHVLNKTADLDGDTYVAAEVAGPDCDDADAAVHPGAPQLDNGKDNDCDGLVDFGSETGADTVIPVDVDAPADCPLTEECDSYAVTCLGTALKRVVVSRAEAVGTPRGVAVIFSGGEGDTFLANGIPEGALTVDEIQAAGITVLRIAWPDKWEVLLEPPYGLDVAACRSSTMIDYLYTTEFLPLDIPQTAGVCGFCVGGNSAGARQSGYALSHYQQDDILDAVIMTSGPILGALAEGCLNTDPAFKIGTNTRGVADYAYGVVDGVSGPCVKRDKSFEQTWKEDSILDGGNDYYHPDTRIEFLIGGLDTGSAKGNAEAYQAKLIANGSPSVTLEILPNAGHGITEFLTDPAARAAFVEGFTTPAP